MMYDVAAYVVRWAEEPDTSLPSVRHLVHRLRQAVSDDPIAYPYNQENTLPPLPTMRISHQVVIPTDARFHGRAIAEQPPPQQQAPTPHPAPHHVPLHIRQLTQPQAATDNHAFDLDNASTDDSDDDADAGGFSPGNGTPPESDADNGGDHAPPLAHVPDVTPANAIIANTKDMLKLKVDTWASSS